jgi:DNA-binding ferritin-like protein
MLIHNKLRELVQPMNHLVAKLDRVAEKINHASYGYAGFFDSVRIEEPDLDRMVKYDTQLVDLSRKISEIAKSFRSNLTQNKFDDAHDSQLQLDDSIRSLELAFDQRKLAIKGIKIKDV